MRRQELSGNEKLREQFFGKGYDEKNKRMNDKRTIEETPSKSAIGSSGKAPSRHSQLVTEANSEDDAGRTSLGKSRRKRLRIEKEVVGKNEDEGLELETPTRVQDIETKTDNTGQKGSSYLDEVMAERSAKKRKKKNKKKNHSAEGELLDSKPM